jgi:hypothetical protein
MLQKLLHPLEGSFRQGKRNWESWPSRWHIRNPIQHTRRFESGWPIKIFFLKKCSAQDEILCCCHIPGRITILNPGHYESENRSCLADAHLGECLRAGTSFCSPTYEKLAYEMQCQRSHERTSLVNANVGCNQNLINIFNMYDTLHLSSGM